MPISIDEFEDSSIEDLRSDEHLYGVDPLVEFLQNHSDKAFTLRELAAQTNIPILELAARLNNLANEGVVRCRGSYWAIAKDKSDS